MTGYSKVCIMCSRTFMAQRLTTAFCSKTCRNRARYLNPGMKANLLRRNSAFAISATKFQMMADVDNRAHDVEFTPQQVKDFELWAREEARKRGIDPKLKSTTEPSTREAAIIADGKTIPTDVSVDDEMANLKLTDVQPELEDEKYISVGTGKNKIEFVARIDNSLPDPNDDGINGPPLDIKPSGDKENKVDNSNNQPSANTVHKGIRKIGSK